MKVHIAVNDESYNKPLSVLKKPLSQGISEASGVAIESFLKHQESKKEVISSVDVSHKASDLRLIKHLEDDLKKGSISSEYNDGEDKVVFPLAKRREVLGVFQADCVDPRFVAWLEYHAPLGGKTRRSNIWHLNPDYSRRKTDQERADEFEAAVKRFKYKNASRIKSGEEKYPPVEKKLIGTAVASGFGRYRGMTLSPQGKEFLELMDGERMFLEMHLAPRGTDSYSPAWFRIHPGSHGNTCIPGRCPQQRFDNLMRYVHKCIERGRLSQPLPRKAEDNSTDKAACEEDQSPKLASNSGDKPAVVLGPLLTGCKPTLHDELFWSTFNMIEGGKEVTKEEVLPRSSVEVSELASKVNYLLPRFTKGARKRERKRDHVRSIRREQWLNVYQHLYNSLPEVETKEFFGALGLGSLYSIPGAYKPECHEWYLEQCYASVKHLESFRRSKIDPEVLSILDEIRLSPKSREVYRSMIKSVNGAELKESGCKSAPETDILKEDKREKSVVTVLPSHNTGPLIIPSRKVLPETELFGEIYHSIMHDMSREQPVVGPPRPLVLNEGMLYFGRNKSALVHECGRVIVNEDGSRKVWHPGMEEDVLLDDNTLWQEAMRIAKSIVNFLKSSGGRALPVVLVNTVVVDGVEYKIPVKLPEFMSRGKSVPYLK